MNAELLNRRYRYSKCDEGAALEMEQRQTELLEYADALLLAGYVHASRLEESAAELAEVVGDWWQGPPDGIVVEVVS